MNDMILELKQVDKVYPSGVHAVKKLDFALKQGSICAMLGPNGAGKSTTLGMICSLVKPTGGEFFFKGEVFQPSSRDYHSKIGVVSQHTNLELDLTAYQNMKIHGLLFGMGKKEFEKRTEILLNLAGLKERGKDRVRLFSGGMKRRLQIVRSLLHRPEFLILDEPTTGLDPAARESVWDMILTLNREGMSILFSTHYMDEAQRYADHVAIIHQGILIGEGTANELIQGIGPWCRVEYSRNGRDTRFFPSRQEAVNRVEEKDCPFTIRETTLEDLFISLTGKVLS